jgi:hypothetical protein
MLRAQRRHATVEPLGQALHPGLGVVQEPLDLVRAGPNAHRYGDLQHAALLVERQLRRLAQPDVGPLTIVALAHAASSLPRLTLVLVVW